MSAGANRLAYEEALLGATFEELPDEVPVPLSYGDGDGEDLAFDEGCALADLGWLRVLLVSGTSSAALCSAAFAGRELSVGEAAASAVLAGDGSVVSVPLLARTGDGEYVACDASGRREALGDWLGWLSRLEEGGFAPFAGTSVDDETGRLVPLALMGPSSRPVLSDYLGDGHGLPADGHVAETGLDGIAALVCHVSPGGDDAYLLLVPPAFAPALWRSLLSFEEVVPVGRAAVERRVNSRLPLLASLDAGAVVPIDSHQLEDAGLVRATGGFVGERALREA